MHDPHDQSSSSSGLDRSSGQAALILPQGSQNEQSQDMQGADQTRSLPRTLQSMQVFIDPNTGQHYITVQSSITSHFIKKSRSRRNPVVVAHSTNCFSR